MLRSALTRLEHMHVDRLWLCSLPELRFVEGVMRSPLVFGSVLHCVALCCSYLQCVAVCCSELQFVGGVVRPPCLQECRQHAMHIQPHRWKVTWKQRKTAKGSDGLQSKPSQPVSPENQAGNTHFQNYKIIKFSS